MNFFDTEIFLIHNDLGASQPGASKGPQKIWDHLIQQFPTFSGFETIHIHPRPTEKQSDLQFAKNIHPLTKIMENLSEKIKQSLQRNHQCLVISGDHSTSAGVVAGIKKQNPDKRIGIVWFDAHADIHSPHTTPSGNMHGMPLAIVTDQDNTLYRINNISEAEHEAWEHLQAIGIISPMALARDVVYLGVRDMEKPEQALIQTQRSLVISSQNINQAPLHDITSQIEEHLKDCDLWYVSFDIDCLDATLVPGTGTPASHGPRFEEALAILSSIASHPKTVCVEVSEFNPSLDQNNQTLERTSMLTLEALKVLTKK